MSGAPITRRVVLPETRALAVLGCFDLLATVFLISTNRAHEANSVMAVILGRFGPGGFALVKALMLGVPLSIAESARKQSPVFVQRALRVGLITYVALLLLAYREPLLALLGRGG